MDPGTQDAKTKGRPGEATGWRTLTFRFDGVCGANCGIAISAGDAGFWNPETKELRHAGCSPSAAVARPERVPWTGLPTPDDDWQRLVAYCRACVLREGLAEPPAYEDFAAVSAVVPAGSEAILAGTDGTLPISRPIESVVAGHRAAVKSAGSAEAELIAHLPTALDVRPGQLVGDYPAAVTVNSGGRTTVVVVERGGTGAAERLRELLRDQNMIAAQADVLRVPA